MVVITLSAKILLAMAIGYFCYKIGIFKETSPSVLSKFIADIAIPFMIFSAVTSMSGNADLKSDFYTMLLVGVIMYAALVVISFLIVKLMRVPKISNGTYQASLIFGNIGFLGLPVAQDLYGAEGVFLMAVFQIHFNILVYSYGLWLMTKDGKGEFKFNIKSLFNPGLVATILASVLYLADVSLPSVVTEPISFIGNIASALATVVLGSLVAQFSLKKVFSNGKMYILSIIRMIIFPLITYLIMKSIFGPCTLTSIVTLSAGMPTAMIVSIFSESYGGDSETATESTSMMNIFCIITIPLMYLMMDYI